MVRPIEISDALTKSETVQREQQNQKIQPEAAQHFQKTVAEKLTEQVQTPNPVPKGDEVVLHIDEQEEEKRKTAQEEHEESRDSQENTDKEEGKQGKDGDDDDLPQQSHIDIKI